ncbi:MAG: hypothetical protein ACUVR0_00050 [Candidatus Aminicenantales bacterium]
MFTILFTIYKISRRHLFVKSRQQNTDSPPKTRYRIILANPTLVKMLGYKPLEELAERKLEKEDLFSPN